MGKKYKSRLRKEGEREWDEEGVGSKDMEEKEEGEGEKREEKRMGNRKGEEKKGGICPLRKPSLSHPKHC